MELLSPQQVPEDKSQLQDDSAQSSASKVLNAALTEEIFNQKCKIHPQIPCDILFLKKGAENHRICILCVQENQIPTTQILSLHQLLKEPDDGFLLTYPVLTDPSIGLKIKPLFGCVEKITIEIDTFFDTLSKEIDISIEKMKVNAKSKLSQFASIYTETIQSYKEAGPIFQLKELVLSQSSNESQINLHHFIENHCSKSIENTTTINKIASELFFMRSQFSMRNPNNMKFIISKFISQVDFFAGENNPYDCREFLKITNETSLLQELEVIPNRINTQLPSKMNIVKGAQTGRILATFEGEGSNAKCYFNYPLRKEEKYIIRVQMIKKQSLINAPFSFLLLPDNQKQDIFQRDGVIKYHEETGGLLTKIVRGNPVYWREDKIFQTKIIEFRIHLAKKMFRVARYPKYYSISELNSPSLIKDEETYFFCICIGQPSNQVKVLEFARVEEFDNNIYYN